MFVGVCLDKSEFACSYPMSNRAAIGHLGRHDSRPTQHPASTRGAHASRLDGTRAPLSKPAEHGPALPSAARSTAGARKGARHCCPCSAVQRLPPGRGAVRRGQHPQRIVSPPPSGCARVAAPLRAGRFLAPHRMALRVLATGAQRRTLGHMEHLTHAGATRSTDPSTRAGGAPVMSASSLAAGNVPEFLTVEEAAELLRVNRKTLYEAIRLEQVPGVARIGKTLRLRRAALLEWTAGKDRDSALGSRK